MVRGRLKIPLFLPPECLGILEELALAYRCSRSDVAAAALLAHADGGLREQVLALQAAKQQDV